MRLRLALLGGFRWQLDAPASLTIPTRKSQALLAFLSLPPGQPHPREKLASLLWGGMREPEARRSLRQSLFTLRNALGRAPALLVDGDTVALDPSLVDVDVGEFERGIASGTPDALERAIALYARLLPERRHALHARIAGAMATLYADRLDEQVERLAHHAVRGDLQDKAIAYLRQAGAKALAKSAHSDAVAYFTQALALLAEAAPGPGRDREELSARLALGPALQAIRGYATPEVEHNYASARRLADTLGTPAQQFQARWGSWLVASHRASASVALDLGRELLTLAERHGDPSLRLEGHHALWPVLVWLGQTGAARPHLEQGMALYDKVGHHGHAFLYGGHDPGVCCWKVASWASWLLGHPARGLAESLSSLRLARELDHPSSLIVALVWACVLRDLRRELPEAGEQARILIALSRQHEASQWLAAGQIMEASVEAHLGDADAAIPRLQRGLAAYRITGAHLFVPYFLSLLARACLRAGRPHEGLRSINEARERIEATGERVWDAEVLRLEGELRLAASADDVPEALERFRRAIQVARGQSARSWELRAGLSLTRLLEAEGPREEARQELGGIYAAFTEGFDTADLQDAAAFLGGGNPPR